MTTTSERVLQRSSLIGTQVITRNTDKKLGVITQLWVDIDQREVVALSLRDNLNTSNPQCIRLSNVHQARDVILVSDEDAIEDVDILNYSSLVGNEVITETGELLGKVRGFKFDIINGQLSSLIIAALEIPLVPARLISTYELPVEEVVSSSLERLIVFEGAEERLNQLTVGILERLGIIGPPWEREEEEYLPTTSTSNQDDEGWEEEPEPVPARWPRQQRAMRYYEPEPEPAEYYNEEEAYEDDYEAWDDKWSDPPNDPPPSSAIGRRPWGPRSPGPLSAAADEPFDPPIS